MNGKYFFGVVGFLRQESSVGFDFAGAGGFVLVTSNCDLDISDCFLSCKTLHFFA